MFRNASGGSAVPVASEGDAETVSADVSEGAAGTLRALYVSGPNGGARHVLPDGLVSLGRGPESTIVIDDPRVSRAHAALHVASQLELTDLGSVNGTFLDGQRIAHGDARPLALGQAFHIGDSALVVRATPLQRHCARRLSDFAQLRAKLDAPTAPAEAGWSLLAVRPTAAPRPSAFEAVLGAALSGEHDWLLSLVGGELLLGVPAPSRAEGARFEQGILERLASYSLRADVRARHLSRQQIDDAGEALLSLFATDAPLELAGRSIIINDPAMKALEQALTRVAPAQINVLILGETGVGKDVFASMIHERSPRSDQPFISVNCASLPDNLLESELFGHERGAFTGAVSAKPGLLEAANGGSIFLDEIGDLPLPLQAKLLRVLESRQVTRLGALKSCNLDVRFVAATNRDLTQDVAAGRFRQDLYYRIKGVTLNVPPLRERRSEIEPLASLFLAEACKRFERSGVSLSTAAVAALERYPWPGNVRELRNVIEHAALLVAQSVIEPQHLDLQPLASERRSSTQTLAAPPHTAETARGSDSERERERILHALSECAGNQRRAAELLGISRRTLVRKIAQLGLPRPQA